MEVASGGKFWSSFGGGSWFAGVRWVGNGVMLVAREDKVAGGEKEDVDG